MKLSKSQKKRRQNLAFEIDFLFRQRENNGGLYKCWGEEGWLIRLCIAIFEFESLKGTYEIMKANIHE